MSCLGWRSALRLTVRSALCTGWHRWRQRQRLRHDRAQLHAMEERELRDLGLGRGAIEHSTAEPTEGAEKPRRSLD